MIEARHIAKVYGSNTVLNDACLRVAPGECVVLTGDNGSGKTTLLHVLMGLRRPDAGSVTWKDRPLIGASRRIWRHARSAWGFLPQQVALPPTASVGRLIHFYARLRGTGLGPAQRWIQRVGLEGTQPQRVDALSGGMQQRLGIALTLFFQPELIVMDEPASSLDPGWRSELAQCLVQQADRGAAVLVTSQLHEAWPENVRFQHCTQGRIVSRPHAEEVKR